MYYERWVLVTLIAMSALLTGTLSLAAWRRRHSPLGYTFFFFTFLITFYTFGYMCELASDTLAAIRFWLRVESVGIAFLPTFWIALAVCHTGAKIRHWPKLLALLMMLSTITFIMSNTSEFHHLHYGPLRLNPEAPFPVVAFEPGPWYWIHIAFLNLAVLLGNILYARAWMRKPSDKSQQAFVLFLGSLFPWLVFAAYILKLIPWGIDPLPVAFLVPGVLYSWATFGLRMLEIAPIARQAVFQKLSDGVLVFDSDGRLAEFNAAAAKALPQLTAAAKGKKSGELFGGYAALAEICAGPTDERREMQLEADGEKIDFQLQRIELYDPEGDVAGFMVVLRDITNFAAIMEGLRLQADIDPLTKAWSRSRWQEDGEALMAQARLKKGTVALILADLDEFKQVNDSYGHLAGDAVLEHFSLTCRKNLRVEDIFGRFGGDEFVIILPGCSKAEAEALAERLRRAVAAMAAGEGGIRVTASFGVAVYQAGTLGLDGLVRMADEALYTAKNAGGNRVGVY